MVVKIGVLLFNITSKRKNLSLYDIFKDWEFEKLNLKFCKYIIGVTKMCTNVAVLSELGRYPLYINLLTHMFMYWHRLENSPSDLLKNAYAELKMIESKGQTSSNNSWLSNIIFYSEKLGIDLNICKNLGKNKFKNLLKKQLKLNFQNDWEKMRDFYLQNQGKLDTYFSFKRSFDYENYLDLKHPQKHLLTKYRLSNHCLRIETGRHERITNVCGKYEILPRHERICLYCNTNCIENEMHFLLECPIYNNLRRDITDYIKKYPSLDSLNINDLFSWIMINEDSRFLSILCAYLDKGLQLRKSEN